MTRAQQVLGVTVAAALCAGAGGCTNDEDEGLIEPNEDMKQAIGITADVVTSNMLASYERLRATPGMPQLRLCHGRDYLHTAFDGKSDHLPVWDGELYLEMHRGTFTTKAALKLENRRGEFMARETEMLCVVAALHGASYPGVELQQAWKTLLLNQFHEGFDQYRDIWERILTPDVYKKLFEIKDMRQQEFSFPTDLWARLLFDVAASYGEMGIDEDASIVVLVGKLHQVLDGPDASHQVFQKSIH